MGDTGNALLAAIGMTMALYHRERTGAGQAVGTSIVNACLLNTSYAWIHSGSDGRGADLANWDHVDADQWGLNARYRMYPTSDGLGRDRGARRRGVVRARRRGRRCRRRRA